VDVECVTSLDSLVEPLPPGAAWMGDFPEPMFAMSSPGAKLWLTGKVAVAAVTVVGRGPLNPKPGRCQALAALLARAGGRRQAAGWQLARATAGRAVPPTTPAAAALCYSCQEPGAHAAASPAQQTGGAT
jgi:hypothetical protein